MGKIFNLLAIFAVVFTVALMVPSMSKAGDLEIGGYVSIVAEGHTDANEGADGFGVEEVEINLHKELADGVSVTVDAQFGGAANVVGGHAELPMYDDGWSWWDDNRATGDVDVTAFGIEQAFVTLPAGPVGLQIGYFNIPIGLEGADKTDITTASHSMTFNNLVPTSGAGVMASFAPEGSPVSVDLYVINGWDSPHDNNSAKTMGGRVGFDIGEIANIGVSYITGRENTPVENNNQGWDTYLAEVFPTIAGDNASTTPKEYSNSETTVIDIDITITPIEALTLAIEINEGEQTDMGISTTGLSTDGEWSALTLSANYKFNETCGITIRLEELEDTDMNVFGVAKKGTGTPKGATWETTTVAISHHIADGAELILEYSEVEGDFDKTDGVFSVGGKDSNSAEAVTAEFVYSF